jgi:2-C-methyl-D-erythritol 4-phosphate cytidylyltransferase
MPDNRIWCVVVAAGSASRFGSDKRRAPLGDSTVLTHAVATALRHADGVVLVTSPDVGAEVREHLATTAPQDLERLVAIVNGGATRTESVRAGVAAVPLDASIILIHDGARPLVPDAVFDRVNAALQPDGAHTPEAVVPVIPVSDSLRWQAGTALDRDQVVAVQTPQGFAAATLRAVLEAAENAAATDDATLAEQHGVQVAQVAGDPAGHKVTRPLDLVLCRAILAERGDGGRMVP